jgi:uncharacterized membrane protein (UPF0127 family)
VKVAATLVVLTVLFAACADGDGTPETSEPTPATTSPVTTSPVTTSPVTTSPLVLREFDRTTVVIDGQDLRVAVADTPELQETGLMGVDDLGELDGMLFVWTGPVAAEFWMKDTLIPLDIWFFDSEGLFVGMQTMAPCEAEPCPYYTADVPFQFALETEVGRLESADVLDTASITG